MSMFYEMIGRIVVALVWRRFGGQIQVAGAAALIAAIVGAGVGAYLLASRDVEEG
jgi:hypothetical protein